MSSSGEARPAGQARSLLLLATLAVLTALGYFAATHWQERQSDYRRLPPPATCDLTTGPCRVTLDGNQVVFAMQPRPVRLMAPISLSVQSPGLVPRQVEVVIRGTNMDMGLNRTSLDRGDDGVWRGETILPICSQRRMTWEAAVRIDGRQRVEIPFPFATERP